MADDQKTRSWPTEGILVALAPAAGYYLVFAYERGYCDYFGIPHALISPTPTTILEFTAVLVAAAVLVFWLAHAITLAIEHPRLSGNTAAQRLTRERFPLLVLALFYMVAYKFAPRGWVGLATLAALVLLLDLLPALLTWKRHGSFDAALNAELDSWGKEPPGLFGHIRERIGYQGVNLVFYGFMAVSISSQMGRAEAERQERFLVPDTIANAVVARMYGNQAICVGVDWKRRHILNRIVLLDLNGKTPDGFTWKTVGVLTRPEEPEKAGEALDSNSALQPTAGASPTGRQQPARSPGHG